jgi:hypothetical protein
MSEKFAQLQVLAVAPTKANHSARDLGTKTICQPADNHHDRSPVQAVFGRRLRLWTSGFSLAMAIQISPDSTLDELRDFVQQAICDRQHLLPGAFQVHERILARHGKPSGLCFTLCGPRSVKFSAIWDAARRTILFYDCKGERFHQSELFLSGELRDEFAGLNDSNNVAT